MASRETVSRARRGKASRTKKDIARAIAQEYKITQVKAKQVIQGVLDAIVDVLVEQERLELRNFGVFEVVVRKERKARNPRTDQPVTVPRRKRVRFKPGRLILQRLNGTPPE